jgi:hypothetical protein
MSKTVYVTSDTPVTAKVREELRRLGVVPDSTINARDIPEWTPEQWAAAKARRKERLSLTPEL